MAHWDRIEARAANGGDWTHLDEAMWLVCRGLSLAEAAVVVDLHGMTLRRWIVRMRFRPELVPDWLIRVQDIRPRRRDRQN